MACPFACTDLVAASVPLLIDILRRHMGRAHRILTRLQRFLIGLQPRPTTMSTLLSRAHCLCTALSHMSRGIKRVRGHFQLFVHQFHSVHNRQRRTSTLCTRTMAKHRERALGPYTCLFINTNNTQKCPRSSNMNRLKVNKNSIHHQGTSNWSKSKQAT